MTQARGMRLFYLRMDTALGLVGILVWIVAVIALAMAITWTVVKISPGDRSRKEGDGAGSTS